MGTASMKYWYPIVGELSSIPQPKTRLVDIGEEKLSSIIDHELSQREFEDIVERIEEAINEIGSPPVFMRTDLMSGKHNWINTCFVISRKIIGANLYNLIEENYMCFMREQPSAIYIREYIPLFSIFTAFWGNMPVSKERRYFINGGKVLCHHPYWPKEAIHKPSIDKWETALELLNKETFDEINLLSAYSQLVSQKIEGYWSVDYAMSKDGTWYLIDMAPGEQSWHPDCELKEANKNNPQ